MIKARRIYMDCAATTKIEARVLEYMLPYFGEIYGNASSLHYEGMLAHKAIEASREQVALLINARPEEIYFTSGGTESDNFALKGIARKARKGHVIVSAIEHPAILQTAQALEREGFDISYLSVDDKGIIKLDELRSTLRSDTILVSIMMANNEIGTLQPMQKISQIVHSAGALFHSDAVQAVGNMPVDVVLLGVDLLSISSHKLYGPKGIGALFIKKGVPIQALMDGGEHEKGKRSGTYNTPGIVGFGKACEISRLEMDEFMPRVKSLRDKLIADILSTVPEVYLNGPQDLRLPGNAHFSIPYVEGEALLLRLDDAGFAVSTGSACSSHNLKISHVLKALGVDAVCAQGSLRISLGRFNTEADIDAFSEALPGVVQSLRQMSPLYKPSSKGA
jgi:cysteine desulfurase